MNLQVLRQQFEMLFNPQIQRRIVVETTICKNTIFLFFVCPCFHKIFKKPFLKKIAVKMLAKVAFRFIVFGLSQMALSLVLMAHLCHFYGSPRSHQGAKKWSPKVPILASINENEIA